MRENNCTQERQVRFRYRMELFFDGKVQDHHYTLKCLPETNLRQKIVRMETKLLPEGCHWESSDAFGNRELLGVLREPHESFRVLVEGEVLLVKELSEAGAGAAPTLKLSEGIALYPEEAVNPDKLGIYRYPTRLTRPGERILAYYEEILAKAGRGASYTDKAADDGSMQTDQQPRTEHLPQSQSGGGDYCRKNVCGTASFAVFMMHRLHADFAYRKAATDVTTTAEQALERGGGVCQDYAQIFLALLRLAGIPARYVTGILEGEGQSHAWVEIALGGYWYGLDPTNDCAVAYAHVKIGSGRDFADCRISQGVFFGAARQKLSVEALVQEIAD